MGEVQSHRDLVVWQKAMDLAESVFRVSECFPRSQTYGLTSQLARAASSVPGNIAEGNARGTAKDYAHFLSIAKGSLVEAETYLLLAVRLAYVSEDAARSMLTLMTEVGKMLTSMRSKLRSAVSE